MPERIDYDVMKRMLTAAVERIRDARDELSTLDAATGDGDHGAAMCKVADAIASTVESRADKTVPALLAAVGWTVMSTDSGSTGPLYGSFLAGMGSKAGPGPLDGRGFAVMLDAGVANLRRNTRAQPGDKTLIDALVPASVAIRAAADAEQSLAEILDAGAQAAAQGAEATREMRAAYGRARNIGDRSIGHLDPGAVSMSLFFAGLKEGYSNA